MLIDYKKNELNYNNLIQLTSYKCIVCGTSYFKGDRCCPNCYINTKYSTELGRTILKSIYDSKRKDISNDSIIIDRIRSNIDLINTQEISRVYGSFRRPMPFDPNSPFINMTSEVFFEQRGEYNSIKDRVNNWYYSERYLSFIDFYKKQLDKFVAENLDIMSISKIEVKNLFGYHSYSIDLNDNLSIIYGTNGLGKTTIFNVLESLFIQPSKKECIRNLSYIRDIVFDEFKVTFSNKKQVIIRKAIKGFEIDYGNNVPILFINISDFRKKSEIEEKANKHYYTILEHYPRLSGQAKSFLFIRVNGDSNSRFGVLSFSLYDFSSGYKKIKESIENKIAVISKTMDSINIPYYLEDIIESIKKNNTDVDSSQHNFVFKLKIDSVKFNFVDYESEHQDNLIIDDIIDDLLDLKEMYNLYIKFKENVESFYNEYDPSYKKVAFNGREIVFVNSMGKKLDYYQLSSGERNIIKELYSITFKVSSNAIVLLDEPEISLHVSWQMNFINSIKGILSGMKNVQILIATHSPYIPIGYENYMIEPKLL